MTLQTTLARLNDLDHKFQALLSETGFDEDGLGQQVAFDPDNPEDCFLKWYIENLMLFFEDYHEELAYLRRPTHGEYPLERFEDGRYGYISSNGICHTLTCGCPLEAKITDETGHSYWARTRLEHDGIDYFLWLHGSVPLDGLTVRERW